MKISKIVGFVSLMVMLHACQSTNTYWVNSSLSKTKPPMNTGRLLVQEQDSIDPSAWEVLEKAIVGFDYHPGYIYQIEVRHKKRTSESQLELVRILSQEQDSRLLISGQWEVIMLSNLKEGKVDSSSQQATLAIDLEKMSISGNDGCNYFSGKILTLTNTKIALGPLASTRKMCTNMAYADRFNQALILTDSYSISEGTLQLYDIEGQPLLWLKKQP